MKNIDEKAKELLQQAIDAGCEIKISQNGNWLEFHGKEAFQKLGMDWQIGIMEKAVRDAMFKLWGTTAV